MQGRNVDRKECASEGEVDCEDEPGWGMAMGEERVRKQDLAGPNTRLPDSSDAQSRDREVTGPRSPSAHLVHSLYSLDLPSQSLEAPAKPLVSTPLPHSD